MNAFFAIVFVGTIWDIGEAASPVIAGYLIGISGDTATFDVPAAVMAAVTVGLMVFVHDPKSVSGVRC